jgi:nucleotide-binding universal stress UspA family protein
MLPVKAILWPADGSETSLRACDVAIEMAEYFKAKLYALQVVSRVPTISEAGISSLSETPGFDVLRYEQKLLKAAQEALHATVARKVPKTVTVEVHVEYGLPAEVIVEFARQKMVDMIVMATHGRSGLEHFMTGSVTEKTVRKSTVPVLTVPPGS